MPNLEEPGLQNCFSLSGWLKIMESSIVFTCLMLHRIGDSGAQVWLGASDLKLDQHDPNYEAEIDTEILGGALMAYVVISPMLLLSYALEGTDRVQRTSLDVLLSFAGAFTLITLGGMTCFAWRRAKHGNNVFVSRSEVVSAGALGVLAILAGCLYLLDAAWMFYRKAFIDDVEVGEDHRDEGRPKRRDSEFQEGIYYVSDRYH